MCSLLLQLGSTNSAAGVLDDDGSARARRAKELHDEAVTAGRRVRVITSGGISDPMQGGQSFNPTDREHWEYVADELVMRQGLPERVLVVPGLSALHTVHEAIMTHELVSAYLADGEEIVELVVVTSDFHAARARHLFGVAIGKHAGLDVPVRVETVPGALQGEELEARNAREEQALLGLRTAPFDPWLSFLKAKRLEGCNRSRRWSRRLKEPPSKLLDAPLPVPPPPPPPPLPLPLSNSGSAPIEGCRGDPTPGS